MFKTRPLRNAADGKAYAGAEFEFETDTDSDSDSNLHAVADSSAYWEGGVDTYVGHEFEPHPAQRDAHSNAHADANIRYTHAHPSRCHPRPAGRRDLRPRRRMRNL